MPLRPEHTMNNYYKNNYARVSSSSTTDIYCIVQLTGFSQQRLTVKVKVQGSDFVPL